MIFVAAHAIDVVIVDHSDQRQTGINQRLNDSQIGDFVDVNCSWLKSLQSGFDRAASEAVGQRETFAENFAPGSFRFSGSRAVENPDHMAAMFQFRSGQVRIDLCACHCSESLMYKQ